MLTNYLPNVAEIPQEDLQRVRSRLASVLAATAGEIDTRPGSVFGDLILSPLALQVAAVELAAMRMFSDLDLGNVAAGIIYNCDFVREYVKNFGTSASQLAIVSGVVRLTFISDAEVVVNKRLQFLFGDTGFFKVRLEDTTPLRFLPVGSTRTTLTDFIFSQLAENLFIVDLPVVGVGTTAKGAQGSTDVQLENLNGITALTALSVAGISISLPDIAKKTRTTFYPASLATRGGSVHFIYREYPRLSMVSPVISGDVESGRVKPNALGIRIGALDLKLRSSPEFEYMEQTLRVPYFSSRDALTAQLSLAHVPVFIAAISAGTVPLAAYTLYSSSSSQRAELAAAAYSGLEKLTVDIPLPRAPITGSPMVEIKRDALGDYVSVTFAYRYDSLAETAARTVEATAVRPVGVDVLASCFTLIHITRLDVNFTLPQGKLFDVAKARNEILATINGAAYPDILTNANISDSVLYAGGTGVRSIGVTAKVQWSVAHRFIPIGTPSALEDFQAFHAGSRKAPDVTFSSLDDCYTYFTDPHLGTDKETRVVLGPRSIGFLIDEDAIYLNDTSI